MSANIIQLLDDPNVFKPILRGERESWAYWLTFLKTLFGLPLDDAEFEIFKTCTGRTERPTGPFTEAHLVIGRKGGKSFMLALIAVYLACFKEYPKRAPGERGMIMLVAQDRRQARHILNFVKGMLSSVPMLRKMMIGEGAEQIELNNNIVIEVRTASFKAVRGPTVVAAINDEIAFWMTDDSSASPDVEVVAAQKPAMATTPGALLLCASSPYARAGVLWEAYEEYFGKDDSPVLVWQATTRQMNPTVAQSLVDKALARDPNKFKAEYLAEFRDDVEGFLTADAIRAVTLDKRELRHDSRLPYVAFVDTAGGSGADSFVVAIAYQDFERGPVLACVREFVPPFSPSQVIKEVSQLLATYKIRVVEGDKFASQFPVEEFARHKITFSQTAKTKSQLYVDLLAMINSGKCVLLNLPKLHDQLVGLRRWPNRSGRDVIDHSDRKHDDVANAVAGALVLAGLEKRSRYAWNIMHGALDRKDRPTVEDAREVMEGADMIFGKAK